MTRAYGALCVLFSCRDGAPPDVPTPTPAGTPALVSGPPPVVSVPPAASSPAPTQDAAAPDAQPPRPAARFEKARIGDTTCRRDDDCAISTRDDCCACCPDEPKATSKRWLDWRENTLCASIRCEPCGKVKCARVQRPQAFRVVCLDQACTLQTR